MKKLALIFSLLLMLSATGLAADAVISRNEPLDPVVLDSANNYEQKKEYDGTPSTPDSVSYSWQWIENSVSKTGPKANFTFNRDSPNGSSQPQTIELVVSTNTDSDSTSVSQPLRDVPNGSISADQTTVDISDADTDVKFSSDVTNVFNQPSTGIVNYNWSIDGTSYDNTSSFTYDFEDNETTDYNVTLNISDTEDYWSLEQQTISVENNSDSTNDDESGGGGGGGGSSDEETYERAFSFGNLSEGDEEELAVEESSFRTLSFTMTNDVENAYFGIDIMDSNPSEISENPPGEDYAFIELDETNISTEDVEDIKFEFRISNGWMDLENKSKENVVLQRYDEGWNVLETGFTERFNGYHHFEASSPGLSYYAITYLEDNLVVEGLSITQPSLTEDETFNISMEVTNTGKVSGWREIDLEVGDSTYTRNVSVENSSSKTVDIELNLSAGNYTATAGEKSLEFEVEESQEALTTDESEDNDSDNTTESESDGLTTAEELRQQRQGQNNESSQSSQQDSGLGLMIILPAVTFMLVMAGGIGYLKKDEIEGFLEEKGVEVPWSEDEMNVPKKYTELREKVDQLEMEDKDVEIKMDHARMLLDQGRTDEAAEVLREVSNRLLQDLE